MEPKPVLHSPSPSEASLWVPAMLVSVAHFIKQWVLILAE